MLRGSCQVKGVVKLPADRGRIYQALSSWGVRRRDCTELPDLIEVVYKNELEDRKKKAISATDARPLAQVTESRIPEESRVEILSGLMRLHVKSDTPALFMDDYQGLVVKVDSLGFIATSGWWWASECDFLPVQGMLEKIEKRTPRLGETASKITGSSCSWQTGVDQRHNQGGREMPFLISLKAEMVLIPNLTQEGWYGYFGWPMVESRCRSSGYRTSPPNGAGADDKGLSFTKGDHWRKVRTSRPKETFGFPSFRWYRVACEPQSGRNSWNFGNFWSQPVEVKTIL